MEYVLLGWGIIMELLRIDFDLWRLLIFLSIIKIFNFIFRNKTVLYIVIFLDQFQNIRFVSRISHDYILTVDHWKERFHKNLVESKEQSKYRKRFSIINFKEKKRFYFMRYFYKLLISSKLFKDVEEIKIKKNIYFFTIWETRIANNTI